MSGKKGRPPQLEEKLASISEDIDTSLTAAIEKLRANRSLPATEMMLAQLAGCSRGTVRSRSKVKAALKGIKEDRKLAKPKPIEQKVTNLREEVETLKKQLTAARDESQVQFNKREALEEKYRKLEKLYAHQTAKLEELAAKLATLGGNSGSVVPFTRTPSLKS